MMLNDTSVDAIAKRLKASREALNLSQADFCRLTGVAANTYNQYESAERRISIDKAMRLCDHAGYTLDWIYRGDISTLPDKIARKLVARVA